MDPFNIKASLKALAASKRQEPSSYQPPPQEEPRDPIQKLGGRIQKDIVKEAPPGLLERAGGTALSGLATVGNLLDVPGSMVRDVATWLPGGPKPANPFDQLASPFTHHNRTTGRDLLRGYGLAGKEDTMGNFTTGIGAEIAMDPLTYLTFGASALTRGGRAAKALNMMDDAPEIASRLLNRRVGKREARHVVTPRMLLENPRITGEARARLQQRMAEMGVTGKDMDRQLGGLAKINMPFSNKPFKFGDKPFTFWGLTDEEGIIGAGKARGRGPDVQPEIRHTIPPPDDLGPSGGSALGGDGPDIPPTQGPAPDITDMPDSPVNPRPTPENGFEPAGLDRNSNMDELDQAMERLGRSMEDAGLNRPPEPQAPSANALGPSEFDPNIDMAKLDQLMQEAKSPPSSISAVSDIQKLDESNYGVFASVPGTKSQAKATLTYASEADETPMLFIDQFEKQPGSPKGSGRALINSMVDKVKDRNPMGVAGNFDTHEQLGAFASVFGKDNVRFLDRATGQPVDIPFAEVNKTPETISKYTAVHYFIEPPKAAAKVEAPQYKPEEIEASRQLGYEIEDIPRSYNEMAADIKSNPVRLLAAESAVNNLIDMVSKEGTPLIQALDQLEWNIDLEFDRLGFEKPSPAEIEHARRGLSIVDRPLNVNDLIEYGKARVADAGKGKAQAEAERIFKKYGSFDMDEGLYYRAVLGEAPKPKQQKRLIEGAEPDPVQKVESAVQSKADVVDDAGFLKQPKEIPPSALQPNLMIPEVVKEAKKRGRKPKTQPEPQVAAPAPTQPMSAMEAMQAEAGIKPTTPPNEIVLKSQALLQEVANKRGASDAEVAEMLLRGDTASAIRRLETKPLDGLKIDGLMSVAKKNGILSDEQADAILNAIPPKFKGGMSVLDEAKQVSDNLASKSRLDSQGGAPGAAGIAPTKVDLNTLEGLPEQAKPIVGDMINKIGQRLFDDVTMEVGGDAAKAVTTGDIDMDTGFIRIYNSAIESGIVDKTTVHELWHHLSKYITPEEVRTVQKEFDDAVKAHQGPLPYELSSIDEYFAHKLTDLTMKYLGREKPASVIGSVWAKALDVFEHIWDAIRQTLGYDQTKKIMYSFLDGYRADAVKLTDSTLQQRLVGDVEINGNILDTQQRVTDTPAFRQWFGESKIVDDNGSPRVMYHGTHREFSEFDRSYATKLHKDKPKDSIDTIGIWFTDRADTAENLYGPRVVDAYISSQKPFVIHGENAFEKMETLAQRLGGNHKMREWMVGNGYDSIWLKGARLDKVTQDALIAFEPQQIKSATANRGTFDPNSKNILESQVDPIVPNRDIAGQLAQAKSAIMGKNLDDIGQSILDSAVGRTMTALLDQSALGQLTKAGIEAARLSWKGYREGVFKEREYMSHHLRTWYDLPNIREDIIMDEELGSLDEFITAAGGDKALGAKNRMIAARKIQNGRVNDLRRLLEKPMYDENNEFIPGSFRVEEQELPAWVGQEKVNGQIVNNPARRQQVAQMFSSWRLKNAQILGDERNEGIVVSLVNGYFARLVSNLPGNNRSLWNPNYGKILDPTHPNIKRRKDWFVGYDDGTSVINDISVDAELSGAHARKLVREQVSPAEIRQYGNVLWERYKDRLMGSHSQMTYGELAQTDPKAFAKINKLTEEIMNLDPRHVEYQIPLFSNDLFSAMELRLEHHHRSIMHAKAIQHLIKKNATARNLIGGDGRGVTLNELLKESKYDSKSARHIMEVGTRGEASLAADKHFWDQEIQPRINEVMRHYQAERSHYLRNPDAQPGTATGVTPYTDPGGRAFQVLPYEGDGIRRLVFPQFFDKKVPDVPNHVMKLEVNLDDPAETMVTWFDQVDDGANFVGESLSKILDNPTNKTRGAEYVSGLPLYALFDQITVPQDVGDAITKFVQGPRTLEEVKPIVRGYDKATNMWKMMQTGMLPFIGFHGRNFGSGQASNFYLGIQNDPRFQFKPSDPTTYLNPIRSFVQPIVDAHKIATGQTIEGAASMPQFAGMNLTDEAATEALRREMYAQGITGEKQGLSAEQLTDTVGTAASQFPGIDKAKSINPLAWQWSKPAEDSTFAQRWLMPWLSKGVMSDADVFRPGQLGRDLGGYTEALNRLAPYIAMRRQGFDPKAAAREVNRAQVDYTNLSNFNREYTRRLFPFASYTLGMTPTVFGELASRPGGGMGRTVMATTSAGQSAEQGVTPDYIRETASIPLGMSEDGTRSYITGFGLPFEDPLQFAQLARGNVSGVLRELGSRMNPVPKSLIEIMTGRSLYQAGPFGGREIEDLDPTIGRIIANINDLATGEKTEKAEPFLGNPWAEYLIANAGPGRMLNTARTITDPRKWDTIPWKLALNLGTGVRVADVSPSAQDAILRERLARVMKDFGGRMYTRPYFPDYAKESWSPQEAEDAAKIDALLKLLGQRAKDRRVQ